MLVIVVLFVWAEQVLGNAHLYPECNKHMLLQEPWRQHDFNQISPKKDEELTPGWYRIYGQAGERLLDINDIPKHVFNRTLSTFAPCGTTKYPQVFQQFRPVYRVDTLIYTDYFYVLSESHPIEASARITTTAVAKRYFAYRTKAYNLDPLYPIPECELGKDLCFWKAETGPSRIEISVTNCGDFYVYFLQPTMIEALKADQWRAFSLSYCTTRKNITRVSQCRNYVNVTDPSRLWNAKNRSVLQIEKSCQDEELLYWTRFIFDNTTNAVIPQSCTTSKSELSAPPCGSLYRGWITGEHPSLKDGRVTRTVCFSSHESCKCIASMPIDVINCGDFYIYKTPALKPRCYSRICLERQRQRDTFTTSTEAVTVTSQPTATNMTENVTVLTINYANSNTNDNSTENSDENTNRNSPHKPQNLCDNYATIVDDSRLFSNPSRENKCDYYFKTAIRFMSSDGRNLQLKENCSIEEIDEFRYYCGSAGLTFMEQLHPDISDVPSQVSVCINTFIDSNPQNHVVHEIIFPRPDCKCNNRQNILVQNCSGYYVYQLLPISHFRIECPARYCTEESVEIGPSSTSSSRPTDVSPTQQPEKFKVEGKIQITQPMLNYRALTADDLIDKESADYKFLMDICTSILNQGMKNVQGIKTKQITGLSLGSLVAGYVITFDQKINAASLERNITDVLRTISSFEKTIGERTFSGQINATQSITDFNECSVSTTCDINAQCINFPSNFSFHCECKEGYEGNGFTCVKIRVEVKTKVEVEKWSNLQIGLVSAAFSVAFLLFVILAYAVCYSQKSKKNTYDTNSFRHNDYDQYLKSDRLEKLDSTKFNMYVAVEPPQATHKSFEHEMVMKNGHTFEKK